MDKIKNIEYCPICNFKFFSDDIPTGLMKTGCYKSIEDAEKAAKNYGWTKENNLHFSNIIGIEYVGGYDGVSEWQCPSCKSKWDRFTDELVYNGKTNKQTNK